MKLRKAFLLFGSLLVVVVLFIIYTAKDLTNYPNRKSSITQDYEENKLLHFEVRLKELENNLNKHNDAFDKIQMAMKNMIQPTQTVAPIINLPIVKTREELQSNLIGEMIYESTCPFQINYSPRPNVQMLDLYKIIKFDNPDGGVWKQGWKIEVDEKDWNKHNKLKVFVIPHSHNDPGWVKTFDEYFISQTKHILTNMMNKLPEDPRRKFIWAEISYFAMWWNELDEEHKEIVRRLIRNNQLEIVTGGWVMNDEASAHWVSIVHQLTEGHQWLQKNLNYTPQSSWSIDPFGMSMTQPMLLKETGLQNMLIQRVHYSVKKQLASTQQLEFRWRQLWDGSGKTDFFTHLMPFYSYDIPHTCGPDPKICCQFDFKRLPGHGLHCPWKIPPQPITDKNVAQKAELLLDQYRKKSKLYKTNVLLVPLGDDFRYDHPSEWNVQFENYQKLFDFMNSHLTLNVQAQFGTLTDYFNALHKEKKEADFPSLSGDFFTYSDRDDHYWSGYYTSRPFYKRMDRVLLSYVRAAEIIHSLAHLSGKVGSDWIVDETVGLQKQIMIARQALALFQHHDAIAGTARDHVVIDYGKRLLSAISACQKVIQQCVHILLNGADATVSNLEQLHYNIDDIRHAHNALAERYQITIGVPELRTKKIVIYNSLAFARREVVVFHVSTAFVEVTDILGNKINCQISPIFEYGSAMAQTKYQLSFVADVPALGLISYVVNAVYETELPKETVLSQIKIYNQYNEVQVPNGFTADVSPSASEFTLQNGKVTASFNNLGLLKAVKTDGITIPVHLDFAKYGVVNRPNSERSGGYLFLPDGNATPLTIENTIVNIIEGPILSSVTVQLPYVHHVVTLYNSTGTNGLGIEIENIVDITKTSNFELAMRLSTNINSSEDFFTDVNGYQIVRRKRFGKLPLQANYYPIPTMAYIEDEMTRLSIVTGTPLGCSSLQSGEIEVMLDRRLNQDDNLGMAQGVLDNLPTRHVFQILVEHKLKTCKGTAEDHPAGFPTLAAHIASQYLLNPVIKLLRTEDDDTISLPMYTSVEEEFTVDFSLTSLRSDIRIRSRNYLGMIIHRQFVDVCYANQSQLQQYKLGKGTVNIGSLIKLDENKKLYKSSLTFLSILLEVHNRSNIAICPMEMQAFVL